LLGAMPGNTLKYYNNILKKQNLHQFSYLQLNMMDTSNTGDKKPKRPRIGANNEAADSRFEKVNYGSNPAFSNENDGQTGDDQGQQSRGSYAPQRQGGYQPRQNNYNNGGYQPRQNNYNNRQNNYNNRQRYNNDGGDQQGGYRPRYGNNDGDQQGGYRPRYNQQGGQGYNQQGGYRPRYNQQGGQQGYQPRQNNYNNRYNQQGGQQDFEGGYQPRGGRQNNNYGGKQGGYQPRQQQRGGYNNQKQRFNNNRNQNNNGGAFPRPGKSFTPRPKRIEYEQPEIDPNAEIRLNKFMANAGICSRREADTHIQNGLVKVNGNVVTELGTKITAKDVVEFNDKVVTAERKCYVLLNKPKDCVTTVDDPNGRLTVMDLVKNACEERIYPVGRLDRNTTGVLLLTNDGDLASKLTHPQYVKKKIYHVWTDKDISEDDMQRIADGIELDDGPIHADAISYATETDRNQAGIEIHSGRNRIVRRIFESLGYHVTKLDRVYFAGLTKKNLPRGRWRYLTQEEVNFLKMGSFE
jgi:23S rRNA pseudouridine2605 synthase